MAETTRNKTDLLALFPLNTTGTIDAQDERDFIESTVGKLWTNIKTSGSPYTVLDSDVVLIVTEAANYEVLLPACSVSAHRVLWYKKKATAAYTLTFTPDGSDTIDDAANLVVTIQNTAGMLVCDGTDWHIF